MVRWAADKELRLTTFLSMASRAARRIPASRTKSRIGRVVGWISVRLGAEPLVAATTTAGVLLLDARSRTESSMLWNGSYDVDDIAFLCAVTPEDGTFMDIGANVGLIFIPVSGVLGPCGTAVAVEPVPVNMARLEQAMGMNRRQCRVELRQVALGVAPGELTLVKEGGKEASGNAVATKAAARGTRVVVPLTLLDLLVEDLGLERLDTIKIDVEGLEVDVFRGATQTLRRLRPIVYGEFNNQLLPQRGVSFADAWRIFEDAGYQAYSFVGRLELEHRPSPPPHLGNVVLVPQEKVPLLGRAGVRIRRADNAGKD
jgi:FkbM family methyltransferase